MNKASTKNLVLRPLELNHYEMAEAVRKIRRGTGYRASTVTDGFLRTGPTPFFSSPFPSLSLSLPPGKVVDPPEGIPFFPPSLYFFFLVRPGGKSLFNGALAVLKVGRSDGPPTPSLPCLSQ